MSTPGTVDTPFAPLNYRAKHECGKWGGGVEVNASDQCPGEGSKGRSVPSPLDIF